MSAPFPRRTTSTSLYQSMAAGSLRVCVLRNEPVRPRGQLDLSDRPDLVTVSDGIRPAAIYDELLHREEVLV